MRMKPCPRDKTKQWLLIKGRGTNCAPPRPRPISLTRRSPRRCPNADLNELQATREDHSKSAAACRQPHARRSLALSHPPLSPPPPPPPPPSPSSPLPPPSLSNEAMMPSLVCLTSRPPYASSPRRSNASCARTRSSAAASPSRAVISVKPRKPRSTALASSPGPARRSPIRPRNASTVVRSMGL